MTLWHLWLRLCPYALRDALVPGWTELRLFVEAWMAAPPDSIGRAAVFVPKKKGSHLVGDDEELTVPPEIAEEAPTVMMRLVPTRQEIAYRHLGGNKSARLRVVLQRIGSFSKAMQLVHRDRPLTDEERKSFASHARTPEEVDWQYIASGTVAALGALYMMPNGVEE